MSEATEWINATGSAATFVALVVAIFEQRAARKWKRAEFVAQLIKEWEAKKGVQAVFQILDYSGKPLVPTSFEGRTNELISVTSGVLRDALELPKTRRERKDTQLAKFEPFEHDLRDFFDQFFEGLARFRFCVEAKLVDAAAFKPYLAYWSGRLSNKALHDDQTLAALKSFAIEFHEGAAEFLDTVGATFKGPSRTLEREHPDVEVPATK